LTIRIKNLRLRTIIGINDWERKKKQDIILNIKFEFDGEKFNKLDDINQTVDYKSLTKEIIEKVEKSEFWLLERLSQFINDIVLNDQRVIRVTTRVDKPHALRFADSVSVESTKERSG
jgi:FolB domain-containing protein